MRSSPERDSLQEAAEGLYDAFSGYALREKIDACPCCHKHEDDQILRSKPLRELGVNEFRRYIYDAVYTWGDDYDFRHFLPRIFELLAFNEPFVHEFVDPELVLGRLNVSEWNQWPVAEHEAVARYLHTLWRYTINCDFADDGYGIPEIESWLCGIGQAEEDLSLYLKIWLQADSDEAIRNLALWIVCSGEELTKNKLLSAYWEGRPAQSAEVIRWVCGPLVRDKLSSIPGGSKLPRTSDWIEKAIATLAVIPVV